MKNLYVTGSRGSGKTTIAAGLALKLQEEGFKVAYFKPVGHGQAGKTDEDAILMQKILKMSYPLEIIVPYNFGPSYLSGFRQTGKELGVILDAYSKIANDNDVVIIGGGNSPYVLGSLGLDSITLATKLKAAVLHVIYLKNDFSLDEAVVFNNYLSCQGIPIAGNIFNNVPRTLIAKTRGIYSPILEKQGYKTIGIIPSHLELSCPTVAEYCEVLGGEILAGEDRLDLPVEDVIVGAMTIESALSYLRRVPNKAVITGGDRADLALAALETNTSVLILTGGLYPEVQVIARANERRVPVILVYYDTYTTIEKLSEVSFQLQPSNQKGLELALENINKHCDWPVILQALKTLN